MMPISTPYIMDLQPFVSSLVWTSIFWWSGVFNVLGLGIPLTYDHLAQQANYFIKLTTSNFQTLE